MVRLNTGRAKSMFGLFLVLSLFIAPHIGKAAADDPTAQLSVNGKTLTAANPGDPITFAWNSSWGTSWSTSFTASGTGCLTGSTWPDITTAGPDSKTISAPNTPGCHYLITYSVAATGHPTATFSVGFNVNTVATPTCGTTIQSCLGTGAGFSSDNGHVPTGSPGYAWLCTNGSVLGPSCVIKCDGSVATHTYAEYQTTYNTYPNPESLACATASGFINSNSCTIGAGQSSCAMNVVWSSSNTASTVTVQRTYSPYGNIGSGASGNQSFTFTPPATYELDLYDGSTKLASGNFVASCVPGTTWDGSVCAPNAPAATNGVCMATHYNCSAGTPANQAAGASQWTWSCVGSNGGTTALCSEAGGVCAGGGCASSDGKCATPPNGATLSSPPRALCASPWSDQQGDPYIVDNGTNWTWTCPRDSSGFGTSDSCIAYKAVAPTVNVTVSPTSIPNLGTFHVHMDSTNAQSCTWSRTGTYANNWSNQPVPSPNTSYDTDNVGWAGPGNATYSFTCTNAVGSTGPVSGSVTIAGPVGAPNCSLTFNGSSAPFTGVDPLQSRTWGWSSSGGTPALQTTSTGCETASQNGTTNPWQPWLGTGGSGSLASGSNVGTPGSLKYGCVVHSVYTVTPASGSPAICTSDVTFKNSATATGSIPSNSCTISAGNSSCSMYVQWSSSGTTGAVTVQRAYSPFGTIATGPADTKIFTFGPPGTYTLNLLDGTTPLASGNFTASCDPSTTWDSVSGTCLSNTPPGGGGGPSVTLVANPASISSGSSSNLKWVSSGATSCKFTGTPANGISTGGAPSGNVSTGALTSSQLYQVDCQNSAGVHTSAVASVTVTVGGGGGGSSCSSQPQPTITASPVRVQTGHKSTITWSATGVSGTCSITGTDGYSSSASANALCNVPQGNVSPPINAQTQYCISCGSGFNGPTVKQCVTVNVLPVFQEF